MYTIVQHSAAGYKGDPQFARALETRQVTHAAQIAAIKRREGVLFASYVEADDFAFNAQYPPGSVGLIGNAPGALIAYRIDGLALYVPRGDEAGLSPHHPRYREPAKAGAR